MALDVHAVGYGPPAAARLRAVVAAAKRADALAAVTVVVPANSVGVSVRRQLAVEAFGPGSRAGAGIAGLAVMTVYRLAELLGAPALAAAGRRPVSTPVVSAAVHQILTDAPGRFAPVAAHAATRQALVTAHRELSLLPSDALDRLADAGERAADLVRVHRGTARLLSDGWYDEGDLMASATGVVHNRPETVARQLGTVMIHLPQQLAQPAGELLAAVGEATDVHVVAGLTGVAKADADVLLTLSRLGLDPPAPTCVDRRTAALDAGIEVVSVPDADVEVRAAVARIVAAARDGVPLARIAVVYPSRLPYARLLHEHLTAAGVAHNGAAVRPLADRHLGRALLDLLQLCTDVGPSGRGDGLRRGAVLGLLDHARPWVEALPDRANGAPLGRRRAPTARWERISRDAGVVGGRDDWDHKLARLADDLTARAAIETVTEEPRPGLLEWWRADAVEARALRAWALDLADRLAAGHAATTWRDLVGWLRDVVAHVVGDDDERDEWPAAERAAADLAEAALDRIATVDLVTGPAPTIADLAIAVELELDADLGRVGRLGEGVLIGRPSAALGVDLDLVVVLGLAESVQPRRPREDPLLSDRDRVVTGGQLPIRLDRIHVEHRHLLAILAGARRQVLVFPRGDLRKSTEHAPSRWLLDVVERLRAHDPPHLRRGLQRLSGVATEGSETRFVGPPGISEGPARRPRPEVAASSAAPDSAPHGQQGDDGGASPGWLTVVPSLAGDLRRPAFAATAQEHRLRRLTRHHRAGGRLSDDGLLASDGPLRRGHELLAARRSDRFTRFDGNLAALRGRLPDVVADGTVVPPTLLEAWAACPHAYLVGHLLRVTPVDDPEERIEIHPMTYGALVHDILDRWLSEQLVAGVPDPDTPWSSAARAVLHRHAEQVLGDAERAGLTGHPLLWSRDRARLLRDLDAFLTHDDRVRANEGRTPVATERDFGRDGTAPVVLTLPDGRTVHLSGRIDRLDRTVDGGIVAVDYKTGKSDGYKGVSEQTPHLGGTKLQLPVYGLAARALSPELATVRAEYWFVSTRGGFTQQGYPLTDQVLADAGFAVASIVDGIASGVFPLRPAEPRWRMRVPCDYCEPDGLGTADAHRDWLRKRHDPALSGYVALVEPEAFDDLAEGA